MFRFLVHNRWPLRVAAGLMLAATAASAGCCHDKGCKTHCGWFGFLHPKQKLDACIDNCADIPSGAVPVPPGTYTNAWLNKQADKAEVDDFVLYYNDFKDGTAELGPFGRPHMAQIIARLPTVPYPVIIQPEDDLYKPLAELKALNEMRRAAVVEILCKAQIPDAADRVVIGHPTAEGLFGDEGDRIYPQILSPQFGGFGALGGIGGGGIGGFGGLGGGFGGLGGGFGGFGGFGGGGFGGGFGNR